MWREGYVLLHDQLPPMVDQDLAASILRSGKSIIFLRECCGDSSWAPWSGSGSAAVAKLEYGQVKKDEREKWALLRAGIGSEK
jgi:gamma-tubulin complex component 3